MEVQQSHGPIMIAPARQMSYLLLADARRNMAQGRREIALKECLAGYRMAHHVGDNILVSYLVSRAISEMTNNAVIDFLSGSSWNQESLVDLKNHLTKIKADAIYKQGSKGPMDSTFEPCLYVFRAYYGLIRLQQNPQGLHQCHDKEPRPTSADRAGISGKSDTVLPCVRL